MLRIGLTGGIGSGKSTVLRLLEGHGAGAIDADAISRSVTASGGSAIDAIRRHFGARFIAADGSLDRALMREHAYAQPDARRQLEAIIHPLVGAGIREQVDRLRDAGRRCVVFDIPLLVESGRWRSEVHRVMVVDCSARTQVQRVVARSGLAPSEVEAIIAAQAPRGLRLAAADLVVCNDGIPLERLAEEVAQAATSFGL